jgi:hypothetical protein
MTSFAFSPQDMQMVNAARWLLRALMKARGIPAARLVSVAKLLHVFEKLPRATEGVAVEVQVAGPRRKHGEIETLHYWNVSVDEDCCISIWSGGHYYDPKTGGDSFLTYRWAMAPGSEREVEEHFASLKMVPDLQSFPDAVVAIDFEKEYLLTELTDDENPLLDDADAEDEDVDEGDEEEFAEPDADADDWVVRPVTSAERDLASRVVGAEVDANEPGYAFSIEECGICNTSIASRALFVDGRFRDELMWGNLCAECFLERGAGIGWGTGQLFAKQDDGEWRLVAGFPPQ